MSNDYEQLKSCILKIKKIIDDEGKTLSESEFATRTSLINPFLECLGYDSRNPKEVVHEYVADIGSKRGEKVDYAVKINGKPVILIEAKKLNTKLDNEPTTQLRRYFNATDARIGVLTDGRIYNFYLDTDKQNVMDEDPYFVFDVRAVTDESIAELAKYTKSQIERTLKFIVQNAKHLKYENEIKLLLNSEIENPSREFITLFARHIAPNTRLTAQKLNQLRDVVKQAFQNFIKERVVRRLDDAKSAVQGKEIEPKASVNEKSELVETTKTPQEAKDAFEIIKAIAAERKWHNDLYLREFKKDDRCLWDNSLRCKIVIFLFRDGDSDAIIFDSSAGSRVELKSPADLYQHRAKILAAIARFANSA